MKVMVKSKKEGNLKTDTPPNDAVSSSRAISSFSSSLSYAFFRSYVLWASGVSRMDTGKHICGSFIASSVT